MVAELRMKDGSRNKYRMVVCCGVLGNCRDKLYIQTRERGVAKEIFIDLAGVHSYVVRNPV